MFAFAGHNLILENGKWIEAEIDHEDALQDQRWCYGRHERIICFEPRLSVCLWECPDTCQMQWLTFLPIMRLIVELRVYQLPLDFGLLISFPAFTI
jgi:hypothetical protein